MSWFDYSAYSYQNDLVQFRKALGKKQLSLSLTEFDLATFRKALKKAQVSDESYFVMELFLEGALLAGVRYYDPLNYQKYCKAVWNTVFLQPKEGIEKKQPHLLLGILENWDRSQILLLENACRVFLPMWITSYGSLVGSRASGANILLRLSADPELLENPKNLLTSTIIETYRRGFTAAARSFF